ncbi:vacuolar protein sorting-associated protein 35 [Mycotypha africana]|uniref:vacuolar protein sorting-associated protein 35 n=1 Tax=Mycotypha africana TaxID=64632 RepID=UPI0023004207|nr:vacuolar protein sorting-associated protein 35 [Mycotypha africana]KAI8988091.1 vacuolar protein sorting-associated protein 35 [Mycotypha africana]
MSPAPSEDQAKLLDEVLNVVKVQAHLMKKCLENNKLMDGLKHCSNMLAELRTSALTPKNYYELYMSIFDAMRHLTAFLTEAHTSGRHHLADLYELVQYAGNIVPRLYLMITVGSAYMSMPDAPIREIMRDMMEMTRGVQHPVRGLFLRYYLSSMTRDYLPIGENSGPEGNLSESINFILINFTEMNKLWVRLQHQGHSRDREKREAERKELRILVGTNLVRLSQLEGVDLQTYQKDILPGILDQVVSCRDVIAQEYLMEVITQVFPDEFHLRTLQPFLSATAQLHPKVNVKQIIISLIDRLAAFANRENENEESSEFLKQREANIRRIANARKRSLQGLEPEETEVNSDVAPETAQLDENDTEEKTDEEGNDENKGEGKEEATELNENEEKAEEVPSEKDESNLPAGNNIQKEDDLKKNRGIPDDVELFVVFWGQIVELVKARPDLTIQDLTALLVSLINLSLSCYPEKLDYVDQILAYAKDKVLEFNDSPDLHSKPTEQNLLSLLLAPIQYYSSALYLLALANYQPLLVLQPYFTRQSVAYAIVNHVLKNSTVIDIPEDVHGVLDLCDVLLRDQKDAPSAALMVPQANYGTMRHKANDLSFEQEEYIEKQGLLARMVHLFKSSSEDTQFLLLSAARKQFGDGGDRIRYTFPPLVITAVKLARRYKFQEEQDEVWEKKTAALFRFIHQVISTLYNKCEYADTCLNLFLLAGQSADECGFEEIAYEFFVEAFTIYEESISDSKAQYQAITCIVGALQQTRVFSANNYDTLITKAALHSGKLLKKPDQCRGVYLSSHLWWATDRAISDADISDNEKSGLFRDGKRALECLQKALKIADSCMDPVTNVELFVEILNRYIYYFEKNNEAVTVKYLNGLIDLINSNLSNMDNPDQHPPTANSSSLVEHDGPASEYVRRHFRATLLHLQNRKEQSLRTESQHGPKYDELELVDI